MLRYFTILFFFLATTTGWVLAQDLSGSEAARQIPNSERLWLKEFRQLPAYLRFSPQRGLARTGFDAWLKETKSFGWDDQRDGFLTMSSERGSLGHTHERLQQTWYGYPVEGSMYILHQNEEGIYAMNGDVFTIGDVERQPQLTEADALGRALARIDAATYKWQVTEEEARLAHMHAHEPHFEGSASYFPEGELVLVPVGGDYRAPRFRLAWKFDIYAHQPMSRRYAFIDATTGDYLCEFNRIHTADSTGTAVTKYSGQQTIKTTFSVNTYSLREGGRGKGIITLNMQQGTSYAGAVDFVDSDNFWNNFNPQFNEAATDAHWGAEMTYDYFLQKHGRNSIDGNGFQLWSFVHYDQGYFNAFWDGSRMTYGDGNGTPLTALDIAGHEITHGLTSRTASLVYQNEHGALNESFSDIFGKAVEYSARPGDFSWALADDLGQAFRDMSNPNRFNDPQFYKGNMWHTAASDNGGVHINSGVQNYWFYLLAEGGSGTTERGEPYNVTRLGIDTAAKVAFRNLTVYLTPRAEYAEARFFAIQSAADLYGICTPVEQAVTNAWHAVGLGTRFSAVPVADFEVSATTLCSEPFRVNFINESLGSRQYVWNFGDGSASNLSDPTHTYSSVGQYTVQLVAEGACPGTGKDTLVRTALIDVRPTPPVPNILAIPTRCGTPAVLRGNSTGSILWYKQDDTFISEGDSLTTFPLRSPVTYRARNQVLSPAQSVGPAQPSDVSGSGNYHGNNAVFKLFFDVVRDLRLVSVWVDADQAGTRDILLEDANGNVLKTLSMFIPAGQGRLMLDIDLEAGSYALGGSNLNLYRNSSGAQYPYVQPGMLRITGSNASAAGYYYYFYDWQVATACLSRPIDVQAIPQPLSTPVADDEAICNGKSTTLLVKNPPGSATLTWYAANGQVVGTGASFTTPLLYASTSYSVGAEEIVAPQKIGPANGNQLGGGGYHDSRFDARMYFEVYRPLTLASVRVDAGSAGPRTILVEDEDGNVINTFQPIIPSGVSRVPLNLVLTPGRYAIGGSNMDLFRNNQGAQFPYELNGYLSIVGTNAFTSSNFYYYFYDWEITEQSCVSPRRNVQVTVDTTTAPGVNFTYVQNANNFEFTNASANARIFFWDFGDSTYSTTENPTHAYQAPGTYDVTLIISNGICSDTLTLQVEVSRIESLTSAFTFESLRLFPNPGNGSFWIEAITAKAEAWKVELFDAKGRRVLKVDAPVSSALRRQINLGDAAPGLYLVRLNAGAHSAVLRYIKR